MNVPHFSHEPSRSILEGLCGIFEAQVPPALWTCSLPPGDELPRSTIGKMTTSCGNDALEGMVSLNDVTGSMIMLQDHVGSVLTQMSHLATCAHLQWNKALLPWGKF